MKLDKNYQLISDDDNYIWQRKRKRKKQESKANEWQNIGYWKVLGQALKSYSRRRRKAGIMPGYAV